MFSVGTSYFRMGTRSNTYVINEVTISVWCRLHLNREAPNGFVYGANHRAGQLGKNASLRVNN
jgi:hypothetical protein